MEKLVNATAQMHMFSACDILHDASEANITFPCANYRLEYLPPDLAQILKGNELSIILVHTMNYF